MMERCGVTNTIKPSEGTSLLFDRSRLEELPCLGRRDLQDGHPRQAPWAAAEMFSARGCNARSPRALPLGLGAGAVVYSRYSPKGAPAATGHAIPVRATVAAGSMGKPVASFIWWSRIPEWRRDDGH